MARFELKSYIWPDKHTRMCDIGTQPGVSFRLLDLDEYGFRQEKQQEHASVTTSSVHLFCKIDGHWPQSPCLRNFSSRVFSSRIFWRAVGLSGTFVEKSEIVKSPSASRTAWVCSTARSTRSSNAKFSKTKGKRSAVVYKGRLKNKEGK